MLLKRKTQRGFSLVEMVVVLVIIAVLITAGIIASVRAISEARVAQVESDLYQYGVSLTTFMVEDTVLVNLDTASEQEEFDAIVREMNKVLPADYKILTASKVPTEGSIRDSLRSTVTYLTQRRDPWGNYYCVSIDTQERNTGNTEYFITVLCAGKNSKANIGGALDKDDIFLLAHYHNGFTENSVYRMADHEKDKTGTPLIVGVTSLSPGGGAGSPPRNIGRPITSEIDPGYQPPLHVHDYVVSDTIPATCTAKGWQQSRCSICGNLRTYELSPTSHKFSIEKRVVLTANETESYSLYKCQGCGLTEERNLLTNFNVTSGNVVDFGFKGTAGETLILPDEFTNRTTQERNRLVSISNNAFYNCNGLTVIGIPNSVQSIGENAFKGCENLETVYYYGSKQEWDELTISETGNDALLNATLVFIEG